VQQLRDLAPVLHRDLAPDGLAGALGYMFGAAERQGSGKTTAPPNTCEKGVGAGAATYAIPVPMPALRAQ
jgi:hypothetical protein